MSVIDCMVCSVRVELEWQLDRKRNALIAIRDAASKGYIDAGHAVDIATAALNDCGQSEGRDA